MANKKFSWKDISEKDPLKPIIKSFEELEEQIKSVIKLTDLLSKENAKLASETPLDGYRNIKKVNSALNELNTQQSEQAKAQQLLIKTSAKLDALRHKRGGLIKAEAVAHEKLKLEIKEARNEAKRIADESINGSNAYRDLTRKTNEAQASFKKLAAQFGLTSKEALNAKSKFLELEEVLEAINKAAKDGRRNVGRYEEAIDKAKVKVKGLSLATKALAAGIAFKAIEALTQAFSTNSDGALAMKNGIDSITIAFQVFVERSINASSKLLDFFKDMWADMKLSYLEFLSSFNMGPIVIEQFGKKIEIFSGLTVVSAEALDKATKAANANNVSTKDLLKSYDGMNDEIAEKIKKVTEANRVEQENIRVNAILRKGIAIRTKELEKHVAVMDDDGRSLRERLAANKESLKVQKDVNKLNLQIAKNDEHVAFLRKQASTNSIEAEAAYIDAVTNRINTQVEANNAEIALLREQSILKLDILDQDLDFIIDDADNRKAVNERIAGDEKQTLEDRQKAIQENQKIIERAFVREAEVFNKHQKEKGKELINFTELLKLKNDEQILSELNRVGVAERAAIRLLEIIKERRTFIQDQVDAQNDLNDSLQESADIDKDLIIQEEALLKLKKQGADVDKILEELDKKRTQQHIENLQDRLEASKKGSIEHQQINQELNDALLDQQIERIKTEKEKEKERLEEIQEAVETALSAIENISDRYFNKRLSQIDEELALEEKRQERLIALADQGSKTAQENLDLTQKRQAELEAERRKQAKRQEQVELGLAAARVYSEKIAQGDDRALASTIAEITALQAFIGAIPGFIEGTEQVSRDYGANKISNSTDGYIARFDGKERILSPEQNMALPKDMSNDDLVALANSQISPVRMSYMLNFKELQSSVEQVAEEIRKKPVYLGMDFDARKRESIHSIQEKNKLIRNHYKNKGF